MSNSPGRRGGAQSDSRWLSFTAAPNNSESVEAVEEVEGKHHRVQGSMVIFYSVIQRVF